jgi:hypothetical protein
MDKDALDLATELFGEAQRRYLGFPPPHPTPARKVQRDTAS